MNVTSLRWGHISPKFHIYMEFVWVLFFLQACFIWKKWKHLLSSSLLAKFISVWKMGCCFDNKTRRDSVLSRTSVFICILRVCKVIEPKHWEKMKRMTETYEETVKHASGLFLAQKKNNGTKVFVGWALFWIHKENRDFYFFLNVLYFDVQYSF